MALEARRSFTVRDIQDATGVIEVVQSNSTSTLVAEPNGDVTASSRTNYTNVIEVYVGNTRINYRASGTLQDDEYQVTVTEAVPAGIQAQITDVFNIAPTSGTATQATLSLGSEAALLTALNAVGTEAIIVTLRIRVRRNGTNIDVIKEVTLAKQVGGSAQALELSSNRLVVPYTSVFGQDPIDVSASANIIFTANLQGTTTDVEWSSLSQAGTTRTDTQLRATAGVTVSGDNDTVLTITPAAFDLLIAGTNYETGSLSITATSGSAVDTEEVQRTNGGTPQVEIRERAIANADASASSDTFYNNMGTSTFIMDIYVDNTEWTELQGRTDYTGWTFTYTDGAGTNLDGAAGFTLRDGTSAENGGVDRVIIIEASAVPAGSDVFGARAINVRAQRATIN